MNMETTRDGYGKALIELARKDRNVVALDCDLGRSTRSFRISEVAPEHFIEMGIAEQDMISTAAGLSATGKIVFVNSFAVFVTGRAFDQIRQQVSLPGANVKICGSSAGLTQGPDGATHQSVLDVALMRSLPNMTVIVPADVHQTEQAVRAAYELRGPVYLRLSRYCTGDFVPGELDFVVGRAQEVKKGQGIVLTSCGPVLKNVMRAAELLKEKGVEAGVVNFHTLKPFDADAVAALAGTCELIASVEEHSIYGGLGSSIAEALAEHRSAGRAPKLLRLGVQDTYGESGTADEMLKKHGLDPEGIATSTWDEWKAL